MWSARQWKAFYAREREMLGPDGISRLLDEAESLFPDAAAIIFPHTRLSTSGALAAAAALAVLRSGADEVLARYPMLTGNYANVLGAPEPTWVAAALAGFVAG